MILQPHKTAVGSLKTPDQLLYTLPFNLHGWLLIPQVLALFRVAFPSHPKDTPPLPPQLVPILFSSSTDIESSSLPKKILDFIYLPVLPMFPTRLSATWEQEHAKTLPLDPSTKISSGMLLNNSHVLILGPPGNVATSWYPMVESSKMTFYVCGRQTQGWPQ